MDVVAALTDSVNSADYIKKMRQRDPELSIEQALRDYRRLGYSDNWINQRLKSIEIRKELTDEWKKHGIEEGPQFTILTDIIYKAWQARVPESTNSTKV